MDPIGNDPKTLQRQKEDMKVNIQISIIENIMSFELFICWSFSLPFFFLPLKLIKKKKRFPFVCGLSAGAKTRAVTYNTNQENEIGTN